MKLRTIVAQMNKNATMINFLNYGLHTPNALLIIEENNLKAQLDRNAPYFTSNFDLEQAKSVFEEMKRVYDYDVEDNINDNFNHIGPQQVLMLMKLFFYLEKQQRHLKLKLKNKQRTMK